MLMIALALFACKETPAPSELLEMSCSGKGEGSSDACLTVVGAHPEAMPRA